MREEILTIVKRIMCLLQQKKNEIVNGFLQWLLDAHRSHHHRLHLRVATGADDAWSGAALVFYDGSDGEGEHEHS